MSRAILPGRRRRVVPDDRRAVLERVDRLVQLRLGQGVVHAGRQRNVGVRPGRGRDRRIRRERFDLARGHVGPVVLRRVVVRGRRDLAAPCLRGGRRRPLEELRGLRGVAARREQRRGDDDRRDHGATSGDPDGAGAAFRRQLPLEFLTFAPRLLLALGLGQPPAFARPSGRIVAQSGASRMRVAEAYRPYRSCTGRSILRQRGCGPILLAPSPVSTTGQPAEGGRARVRHQARPGREGARGGGAQRPRSLLQGLGARFHDPHRGRRRDHHLAHDGLHPVPEPADPRVRGRAPTCSRSDCRSGPSSP